MKKLYIYALILMVSATTMMAGGPPWNWTFYSGTFTGWGLFRPAHDSTYDIGTASLRWRTIYAASIIGHLTGTATNADSLDHLYGTSYLRSDVPDTGWTLQLKRLYSDTVGGIGTLAAFVFDGANGNIYLLGSTITNSQNCFLASGTGLIDSSEFSGIFNGEDCVILSSNNSSINGGNSGQIGPHAPFSVLLGGTNCLNRDSVTASFGFGAIAKYAHSAIFNLRDALDSTRSRYEFRIGGHLSVTDSIRANRIREISGSVLTLGSTADTIKPADTTVATGTRLGSMAWPWRAVNTRALVGDTVRSRGGSVLTLGSTADTIKPADTTVATGTRLGSMAWPWRAVNTRVLTGDTLRSRSGNKFCGANGDTMWVARSGLGREGVYLYMSAGGTLAGIPTIAFFDSAAGSSMASVSITYDRNVGALVLPSFNCGTVSGSANISTTGGSIFTTFAGGQIRGDSIFGYTNSQWTIPSFAMAFGGAGATDSCKACFGDSIYIDSVYVNIKTPGTVAGGDSMWFVNVAKTDSSARFFIPFGTTAIAFGVKKAFPRGEIVCVTKMGGTTVGMQNYAIIANYGTRKGRAW